MRQARLRSLADEAFFQIVGARLVESTSKLDLVRGLGDLGIDSNLGVGRIGAEGHALTR